MNIKLKLLLKLLIIFSLILLHISCFSSITINFDIEDYVYISNDLNIFLKKNKKPKIVIRIPQNIPQSIVSQKTNIINENSINLIYNIEKELFKSGFRVKDRILVESLYRKGIEITDYKSLKKAIDIDIIFEIVDINFYYPIVNKSLEYISNKNINREYLELDKNLLYVAKMDINIIIVEKGYIDGILRIFAAPDIKNKNNTNNYSFTLNKNNFLSYSPIETYKISSEEWAIQQLTNKLITYLNYIRAE